MLQKQTYFIIATWAGKLQTLVSATSRWFIILGIIWYVVLLCVTEIIPMHEL